MKELFRSGFIIEICVLASTFLFYWWAGPNTDEARWFETVYGICIVVILPIYLITRTIYKADLAYKHTPIFLSFAMSLTPIVIITQSIEEYFQEISIQSLFPTFSFFGLFEYNLFLLILYSINTTVKVSISTIVLKFWLWFAKKP